MEKIIFLIFVAITAIDSKYKQNIWIHDKQTELLFKVVKLKIIREYLLIF